MGNGKRNSALISPEVERFLKSGRGVAGWRWVSNPRPRKKKKVKKP